MNKNDQFNPRELSVLLRELQLVLQRNIQGDIVELGCYKGLTSLEIQRTLGNKKRLYLYDSFAGLPPKVFQDASPAGSQFKEGELPASKQEVINLFKKSGLQVPHIKKAWFSDLMPEDLPAQIALAFLDGDFYESILDSLKLVWPLLMPGAVVLVDDYQNEALPGAAKAVNEWLKTHPAKLRVEASLAVITV
ncbi:MAG: methyltransferase [Candidatus Saccharibacteria bacterium]|nr:methyltransferase [Candidatus Saccharibacteria bacterium]